VKKAHGLQSHRFVLHSSLARWSGGDYVLSGKLLSLVISLSLTGLTFAIIRRFGVPRCFALCLAVLLLLTDVGFGAATGIRADALAALFQLSAVALVAHLGPRLAVVAGALAAMAVFTKISACWAPIAIALWLLREHRRDLLPFMASFIGSIVAFGIAVQVVSAGRFLDNFATVAFSGFDRSFAVQKATLYTLAVLLTNAPAMWALVPFIAVSCLLAVRQHEPTVYHLAWPASVLIVLLVMADRATDVNQLLDPIVLGAIVVGAQWPADGAERSSPIGVVLAVAVLWAGGSAFALHLRARAQEIIVPLSRGERYPQPTADTLLARIRTANRVLAEDAGISVARGDRPVVLDAWAIPKIERRHPEWAEHLARRVEAGQFDYVILLFRFEAIDPNFEGWYGVQFGKTVMSAVKRRYRWAGEVDGFHVYARR
jgi:hypothetical protein